MKIIRPYAKIIVPWAGDVNDHHGIRTPHVDYGGMGLGFIEWCARISHRAEDKQTGDSWRRFIQSVVIEHGDWSVVEHVSVSVDAVVDRGITHEWVRHRLFSFTQESTRFVNYEKKMVPSFIYPQVDVECKHCLGGNEVVMRYVDRDAVTGGYHNVPDDSAESGFSKEDCIYDIHWLDSVNMAEESYIQLLKDKWRPQEARSVFPNALASRIVITGNLRNWRHLFIMRTTSETHPQFRQVSIPLLQQFKDTFPILFYDIIPMNRQIDNLRLPR